MSDSEEFVRDTWELFSWRIMSNYVSPWEREQLHSAITGWDQWCAAWSRAAEDHVRRGDEAAQQGRAETAHDAYIRAGLFYHWGSFLFGHQKDQFRGALEGAEAAFAKAAPHSPHRMEIVNIPFENTQLRGYLRRPGDGRWPLVVLTPGADSTKEELFDLGSHILRRGFAVYCFDGPGHGLVSFEQKLRADYEVPLKAVLDALLTRDDIESERTVVGGISYGGMFAIRAGVFDDRVKAVFSMSSWYSAAGRFPHQRKVSQVALEQYMGDPVAVQNTMTLEGIAERLAKPLLQVYGGKDAASPPAQAERVGAAVKGPQTLKVFEEGVHVCNNVWYKARPFVADWLAETMQTSDRGSAVAVGARQ